MVTEELKKDRIGWDADITQMQQRWQQQMESNTPKMQKENTKDKEKL